MTPTEEKPVEKKKGFFRPHSLRVGDRITNASQLTLRKPLWPLFLVTIVYFLWGFAWGLLDTLNKHFQNTLGITRTRSSGLQAAYCAAYPLASLGYGNWVLRHYGYRAVLIMGLCLEGIGTPLMWPAALKHLFGGFCDVSHSTSHSLLTHLIYHRLSAFSPTYRQRDELNLSHQPSRTTPGIEPTVAWAPTCQRLAGDVLSLLRLCVAPGLLPPSTFVLQASAPGQHDLDTTLVSRRPTPSSSAANPYMAGTLSYWSAQAVQAIGIVVGPVLGSYIFFKDTAPSAFVDFVVQVVFYLSVIPEVTDTDMAEQAYLTHVDEGEKPFFKEYKVFYASFAQFCYVGAQVAITSYFINYATETRAGTSSTTAAKLLAGAQGCFTIGRFSGSAIMAFIRPRKVFLAYLTLVIVFCSAAITQRGNTGIAMLMVTLYFESRGLGWIVAGVVGGACVPPLTAKVADLHNSTALAMVVPVCFFIASWTYTICCNFVPAFRDVMDRVGDSNLGLEGTGSTADVEVVEKETNSSIEKV
ncbi:hypothetical protein B0H16DRAFT_1463584 [Mycena metata]|uniref:MFS general substrate transporter n=1 Tax=Mycena metata TaxID=1033252 RepID=A0AAD7II31_9AGAR|nr:hypothetical protein B0H16DRAFT_1463584 [Mycena metata]